MACLIKLILISSLLGLCRGRIDSDLIKALGFSGRSDVLINFKGGNSEAIKSISKKSFKNRLDKAKALSSALQSLRNKSQGALQKYLDRRGVKTQSFWSSNQMVLRNAPLALLRNVNKFGEVSRIQALPKANISPVPILPLKPRSANKTNAENKKEGAIAWGVARIGTVKVWSEFSILGQGVVVANIDYGVRATHEALKGNFRKDHGWLDPSTQTTTPTDPYGHGTHTMGTIAGSHGIGVAPGATWIACRGCTTRGCDTADLLACGQFMLAPTNPDGSDPNPSLIPDVVCNSWGGNAIGGADFYNPTIAAWTEAGILHAFSIGNHGPFCRSGGSPADQPKTFSVGATDIADRLAYFSSKGPAGGLFFGRRVKPDISAPGVEVRSAHSAADDSYRVDSGTSMAAPHVAGVMALMLSAHRINVGNGLARLSQEKVVKVISETAVTKGLTVAPTNFRCDGFFAPRDRYPNNQFGHGLINAWRAVNATVSGKLHRNNFPVRGFPGKKFID